MGKIDGNLWLIGLLICVMIVLSIVVNDQGNAIRDLEEKNSLLEEEKWRVENPFVTTCVVEDLNGTLSDLKVEITYPKNVIPEEALDMRIYF